MNTKKTESKKSFKNGHKLLKEQHSASGRPVIKMAPQQQKRLQRRSSETSSQLPLQIIRGGSSRGDENSNNHFQFGSHLDFIGFNYDEMDKTPTYGEHTEETKLILTNKSSTAQLPKEFTVPSSVEQAKVTRKLIQPTSHFTLQKQQISEPVSVHSKCTYDQNNTTEDSFDRYRREAEELYEKKVKQEFAPVLFNPILNDATTCKQEVSQRKTPSKTSGILQLLSSLNGLTPEGMAHLMETQERIKSKTATSLETVTVDKTPLTSQTTKFQKSKLASLLPEDLINPTHLKYVDASDGSCSPLPEKKSGLETKPKP